MLSLHTSQRLVLAAGIKIPATLPHPAQSDVQRLKERLHTIYTGGSVVPLPFLRASDAFPSALLMKSWESEDQEPQVFAVRTLGGSKGSREPCDSIRYDLLHMHAFSLPRK